MRIVWSPLALERIGEIAAHIAQDNPEAARLWVEDIFASVQNLVRFPESGRRVPEVRRNDLRELVMGNYRLIYRVRGEEIAVLTVRHFRQVLPIEEVNETVAANWG
jgi:plasmid stabilization system protein ParE